jgi:hypothetical protein
MSYFDDCLKKYNELDPKIKNIFGAPEVIKALEELEAEYAIGFDIVVLLVAIDELALEDIAEYLETESEIDAELADEIATKMEDKIFSVIADKLAPILSPSGPTSLLELSPKDRKEMVQGLFLNKLAGTLKIDDDPEGLFDLNFVIFQAFNDDPNFEDKVIDDFYKNQEVLTTKPFFLNGEKVKASVANWLKDFMRENGSELFSSMTLSKYFISSPNIKVLDENEKALIKRLLKLYRNLVFFPESMEGIPPAEWQLFPFEIVVPEVPLKNNPVVKPMPVAKLEPVAVVAPVVKPKPVVETPNPELIKLQNLAQQYPAGSLENKAIVAEIKRLTRK